MDYKAYGRSIVLYMPTPAKVDNLLTRARGRIGELASLETVLGVMRHNPDTVLVFSRGEWTPDAADQPTGFVAMLPLTADGLDALFDGRLDTGRPDLRFVCRQNERPVAIYFWAIMIEPAVAGGIALVMERLTSDKNRDLPLYCKAANDKAHALFLSLGFRDGAAHKGRHAPHIMGCLVDEPMPAQPFDTYRKGARPGTIGIKVVHDLEELAQVRAVRAATYLAEQEMPYDEDVDGNDLTATHLIGYVGDEPAGCVRIRYFAGFVKLERLAVLARFRRSRLAFALSKAAIAFCQVKGYERFYGQAEGDAIKLWTRLGFVQRDGGGLTYLTNRRYFEGDLVLPSAAETLTPYAGAEVLLRAEGRWDRAGRLEARQ